MTWQRGREVEMLRDTLSHLQCDSLVIRLVCMLCSSFTNFKTLFYLLSNSNYIYHESRDSLMM
jgi:hypothetical protein